MLQDFHPTLTEKVQLTHDVWRFRFTLQKGESLTFTAGQYMILRCGEYRRLYSVLSTPAETEYFDLLVQIVPNGIGSTCLITMKVGDTAFFQGPAGIFTVNDEKPYKVFLATGTGIAPIMSMLQMLLSSGWTEDVYLFWGLRAKADLYLVDEIKKLATTHSNLHVMIGLSQEADESIFEDPIFRKGRINLYVHAHMNKDKEKTAQSVFYICGAHPVVESLRTFLMDNGIEKSSIHFEKFV